MSVSDDTSYHQQLLQPLIHWRLTTPRPLPWRSLDNDPPDPYAILLSEFMLQQTTVTTVIPYFQKFMTRWPSVADLAASSLHDIMALWQGLGYYQRCRALHQTAQKIVHEGWPSSEKGWRACPGVGPYTAAAMMSLLQKTAALAVDGNTVRVLSRWTALYRKDLVPWMQQHLQKAVAQVSAHDGRFLTEALIDLGATVCRVTLPLCSVCPIRPTCLGYQRHSVSLYPDAPPRVAVVPQDIHVFWVMRHRNVWMHQRKSGFPLAHTYSCPEYLIKSAVFGDDAVLPTAVAPHAGVYPQASSVSHIPLPDVRHGNVSSKLLMPPPLETFMLPFGMRHMWVAMSGAVTHRLTHRLWTGWIWTYTGPDLSITEESGVWVPLDAPATWPLSRWMQKIQQHVMAQMRVLR